MMKSYTIFENPLWCANASFNISFYRFSPRAAFRTESYGTLRSEIKRSHSENYESTY